ncbi:putative DNA helicase [Mycoplasmopsis maculosa]|uniref:Putative DNA helicase n=1 Tax=Mycoplasmopsis maculosa TaxID=114885 RepID=A0A449B479_9BACT|nr:AAA domain-containing protein [Mycoplasmopsis maculosa]VEU75397.1 putative DNA helicase [Mycoplasmopsis maculosa]
MKLILNILNKCDISYSELINGNNELRKQDSQLTFSKREVRNKKITILNQLEKELESKKLNKREKLDYRKLFKFLNEDKNLDFYTCGLSRVYLKEDNNIYDELIRILKDPKLKHKEYDNFLVVAQTKDLSNLKIEGIEVDANAINLFFKLTVTREINSINNDYYSNTNNTENIIINFELQRINISNYNLPISKINRKLYKIDEVQFTCNSDNKCNSTTCNNSKLISRQIIKSVLQNTKSIFKKNEDPLKLNDIESNFRLFLEFYDDTKNSDTAFFLNLSNKNIILEKKQNEKDNIINFDNNYLYLFHKNNFNVLEHKKDWNLSDIRSKTNLFDSLKITFKFFEEKNGLKNIQKNEANSYNFDKNIEKIDENINVLNKEIKEINVNLNNFNNDIKTYNGKIRDIQNLINKYQILINEKTLEKEIEEIKNKIKKEEKSILEYENEINKVTNKQNGLTKEINSKNLEINRQTSLKKEYENLISKINNEKYLVKRVKSIKIEPKTKDDVSVEIESYFKNNSWKRYQLSTINIGEKTIINRSYNSIKNLFKGYIKEPSFLPSLIELLTVKIDENSKVIEDINNFISKYNLNEKQVLAFKKAIFSDALFLLQGPPGTGKTQVISALIDYYQYKNQNIMLTSSTHEAIDNVFDRFARLNPINPNIFAIKVSSGNRANNINPYSKENLSNRYIKALISEENLLHKTNSTNNKIFEFCNDINKDINENNIKIWNLFIKKIIENGKKIEEFKESLEVHYYMSEDDGASDRKYSKKIIDILEKYDYLKIGKELKKIGVNSPKNISDYVKNEQNKNINDFCDSEVLFKIKNKLNIAIKLNDLEDKNEDIYWNEKLVDVLFDNELVNLFGLTTTSSSEIEHNGKFIDLTMDYKIDLAIMDETSKSNLFEIINRCLHSGKSILCGDAYQLPPTVDFSEELYNWVIKEKYGLDNVDKKMKNDLVNKINDSLAYPYFNEKIKELTNMSNGNSLAYEFLDIQHRFPDEICHFINVLYKQKNQELKTFNKDVNFKKYSNITSKLNLIDTNTLPIKYIIDIKQFDNKFNLVNNFDHNMLIEDGFISSSFIKKFNQSTLDTRMNQYNAIVIVKIIQKLINDLEHDGINIENEKSKIGVIALTRNQAIVIRGIIQSKYPDLYTKYIATRSIVIDTIDNFQGRECEFIIVDLVRSENKGTEETTNKRNTNFLNDEARLNVAFSRTKNILIVVGDFSYYKNSSQGLMVLKKYINNYLQNKDYFVTPEEFIGKEYNEW